MWVLHKANAQQKILQVHNRIPVLSCSVKIVKDGEWLVSYEHRVETNGRTDGWMDETLNGQMDGGKCITCHINAVHNKKPS